ncbi:MAG: hypothetical protein E5X86_19890 [Mesorhizobium sp.]|nr:MAG: hypothetical protein E5X86_19890 [Mesorhizobium sp.]
MEMNPPMPPRPPKLPPLASGAACGAACGIGWPCGGANACCGACCGICGASRCRSNAGFAWSPTCAGAPAMESWFCCPALGFRIDANIS